jgi:hypothetical protein
MAAALRARGHVWDRVRAPAGLSNRCEQRRSFRQKRFGMIAAFVARARPAMPPTADGSLTCSHTMTLPERSDAKVDVGAA